ncbi:MAG: hypothetical protein JNL83_04435 [Myxococcales bacterium]|nr:hypothetical protein [Myxococcales bacterium]
MTDESLCLVHDINNMLTAIGAAAAILVRGLGDQPAMHGMASRIVEASDRASGLARELLAAGRTRARRQEAFDVHDVVRAACRLLQTVAPELRTSVELRAEQSTVLGDRARLEDAILNLGLNARDAQPGGGTLRVSTANVVLDGSASAGGEVALEAGTYLEIVVSDDGTGMPPEVARRAAEPFFTTKAAGQGTGLGLAAVHRTVAEHRGAITVESAVGDGTTFRLVLPVSTREACLWVVPEGSGRVPEASSTT